MKTTSYTLFALLPVAAWAASTPDAKFFKHAAEGGIAEVQLGQLAQEKSSNPKVKDFGSMMVTDHSAANDKLKAIASSKNIDLPSSPSVGEMAEKAKLEVLSGTTFDKSYIDGMVKDHKEDIAMFEKEAQSGKDPDAKAFAVATLPTLKMHLKKIESLASSDSVANNR